MPLWILRKKSMIISIHHYQTRYFIFMKIVSNLFLNSRLIKEKKTCFSFVVSSIILESKWLASISIVSSVIENEFGSMILCSFIDGPTGLIVLRTSERCWAEVSLALKASVILKIYTSLMFERLHALFTNT